MNKSVCGNGLAHMRGSFVVLGVLGLASCSGSEKSDGVEIAGSGIIDDSNVDLDIKSKGSYEYEMGEYRLPVQTAPDPRVLARVVTDVRAVTFLPKGDGPFPILVLLHGNHSTCGRISSPGQPREDRSNEYTRTGTCPDGWVEAPSYLGYNYLAEHMASHGYVVVSINANRGITAGSGEPGDRALIDARGKLVLKHLAQLRKWHDGTEPNPQGFGLDLKGKLDFNHVGLMGHSRGGEGVRSAYDFHKRQDPNTYAAEVGAMHVDGILEFAPVDMFASRPLSAIGTNWGVVIGSCDGDVSNFMGTGTFRRRRIESGSGTDSVSTIFVVPGANHNYFNSEWQTSDAYECGFGVNPLWNAATDAVGSQIQRDVGLLTLSSFFRGYVGLLPNRQNFQRVYDPQFRTPKQISTLIDPARESLKHETVELVTQLNTSKGANAVDYQEMSSPPEANRNLAKISWSSASDSNYYDTHLWDPGADLSSKWILGFSVARFDTCLYSSECVGSQDPVDFDIQLLFADESTSNAVHLADYASVANNLNYMPGCRCWYGWQPSPTDSCTCIGADVSESDCKQYYSGEYEDNKCIRKEQPIPPDRAFLFHQVPIELKDFGAQDLTSVKGLRFTFRKSPSANILIDKLFTVRSADK